MLLIWPNCVATIIGEILHSGEHTTYINTIDIDESTDLQHTCKILYTFTPLKPVVEYS